MNKKLILAVTTVFLILAIAVVGVLNMDNGEIDCDAEYEKTLNNEMNSSDISEECRPLPEDVENQLLIQALDG